MSEQALTIRDPQLPPEPADLAVFKAPITPAQAKIDAVANLTMSAYAKASTLQLTPEEVAALQADFPDEAFQPGAAGKENLIYIEHAHLRDRLNQVFHPGQWSIVPRNRWAEDFTFVNKYKETVEASRVYVEAMLCIRGCFVAEAVGDMVYYKNNDSQNYGDAVEGAKTAALRRCAKELGIGLQAWKKDWCLGWWERRRRGTKEPPKDNANAKGTAKPPSASNTQKRDTEPKQATEEQRQRWISLLKPLGQSALDYAYEHSWLLPLGTDFAGEPLETLELRHVPATKKQADAILAEIQGRMDGAGSPPEEPEGGFNGAGDQNAPEGDSERSEGATDDGVETITGKLEAVSVKEGRSGKGPWKRFGVKVCEEWFGTFNSTLGELAKKDKGHTVTVHFKREDRGNELVGIERARNT